jgi:hypothetical protein
VLRVYFVGLTIFRYTKPRMSTVLRFLLGVGIAATGVSMVIRTEWIFSMFGRVAWAEEYLGLEGGSRLFYKLLGIILAFFGILTAFGLFEGFFGATAGQLLLPPGQR